MCCQATKPPDLAAQAAGTTSLDATAAVHAAEASGAVSVGVCSRADCSGGAELAGAAKAVALVLTLGVAKARLAISKLVATGPSDSVADESGLAVAIQCARLATVSRRAAAQAADATQAVEVEVTE